MPARQLPSDVEKAPVGNPVNQPASGTYGDKANLDRLESNLPDPTPGSPGDPNAAAGAPPIDTQGVTNVRSNRDAAGLPGLPAPILTKSDRPNSPAGRTPLDRGNPTAAVSPSQKRLALATMLAESPDVSEETRELAKLWVRMLTG